MIKKDPIEVLTAKVEKLTTTLERLVDGLIKQAPERKTYTKKATPKKVATKSTRNILPPAMYDSIGALALGESVNITSYVREHKVSFQGIKDRVYAYAYHQRQKGRPVRYSVSREGWEITVSRTA